MFTICKIVAPNQEDKDLLSKYLGKYPLDVLDEYLDEHLDEIPILIIGWQNVKRYFPDQNIIDKEIKDNLSWTYSKEENEDEMFIKIEEFINQCIQNWLPNDFVLYDSMFTDISLLEFFDEKIDKEKDSFIYFHKEAMYINNDGKNFIINLKSLWMSHRSYKKIITENLNNMRCKFYSYKNMASSVDFDLLKKVLTLENIRWVKYNQDTPIKYFQIIPGVDINKYIPFIMSNVFRFTFTKEEKVAISRACERDVITEWMSSRYICFDESLRNPSMNFIYRGNAKLAKINFSNKKALTGRINSDDSYNPQNLSKSNDERTKIVSRFTGGKVVVFDYTSFEARIALYFCEDDEFIHQNYKKDLHFEVGKLIFPTTYISNEQREFSKLINHSILYGASMNSVLEKLKNFENREIIYEKIKEFLRPIMRQSYQIRKFNEEYGYIVNKWGTIIRPKDKKDYASFNNYIQSTATEILVDKLFEIKKLMKNHKSEFLFQVHDSVVFDISPDEKGIIKKLLGILTNYKGMKFGIRYRSGINYKDLSKEYQFFG